MAGIWGILDNRLNELDLSRLGRRISQALTHEDWYRREQVVIPPVALGQVDLATVYMSSPLAKGTGVWGVLDGELYEVDRLRRLLGKSPADTAEAAQLILDLYQAFGTDFVQELNGCFACAIWDRAKDRLILISDRYGMRPLYYARCGHRFLFSSEIKGLLADPTLPRQVNPIAVQEFFRYQFLLDHKTLLTDVHVLPPASLLEVTEGQLQKRCYWRPSFNQEDTVGVRSDDYVEELICLFQQAIARQTALGHEQSKPVALFLSGGLDSRTMLGFLSEAGVQTHCYTFGVPKCADLRIAQEAARITSSHHRFYPLTADGLASEARRSVYITDGLIGCTHLYALSLLPEVRERSNVSFTGFAGDLLLGGSYLSRKLLGPRDDEQLAAALQNKASIILRGRELSALLMPDYCLLSQAECLEPFRNFLHWTSATLPGDKSDHFFLYQHVRRFTLQGLVMQRSQIEYRTPFFDNDLFDFICRIPPRLRIEHRVYMAMLRRAFPVLAHLPYQKTGLPADAPIWQVRARGAIAKTARVATRLGFHPLDLHSRRRGFHHYASWFRSTLRPFVENTLFSTQALSRPYFRPTFLRGLVDEHMNGRRDRTQLISKLLTFELWHQLFLD
jgi:asparagine synthase (glutamine-hydrolysing)